MRLLPLLLTTGALIAAGSVVACSRNQPAKPAPAGSVPNGPLNGKVLEVLPAPPYSYLRLLAPQGEVWTAVPAGTFKVGDQVTVMIQIKMDKFPSAALNRTFDTLYMGTTAPAPGTAPAAPSPMVAAPAAPAAPDEKVEKASGANAHAINELYAHSADLKEKTVVVKGKVVKYNEGIMGKTWMHLRDGSGTAAVHDNDLTVTTKDTAKVGAIVTIKGTLRLHRDVGSGYVYPVIVEDAKIVR